MEKHNIDSITLFLTCPLLGGAEDQEHCTLNGLWQMIFENGAEDSCKTTTVNEMHNVKIASWHRTRPLSHSHSQTPTVAVLLTAGIVQQQDIVHSNIAPTVHGGLQQYLKRRKKL